MMTYDEVLNALKELSPEQLQMTATVEFEGQFYPIRDTFFSDTIEDKELQEEAITALGEGHPFLLTTELK
jgi:hypothetical protein